jgi:hypothetical protein
MELYTFVEIKLLNVTNLLGLKLPKDFIVEKAEKNNNKCSE